MHIKIQELKDFFTVTKVGSRFNKSIVAEIERFFSDKSINTAVIFGYVPNFKNKSGKDVSVCSFSDDWNEDNMSRYPISRTQGLKYVTASEIQDLSFDAVIVVNALEFSDNVNDFLTSVLGRLKEDGKALIISMSYKAVLNKCPFANCPTFSKTAIERVLRANEVEISSAKYICYKKFKSDFIRNILEYFLKFYGAFLVIEGVKITHRIVDEEVARLNLSYLGG